jgi:hypothetical protein
MELSKKQVIILAVLVIMFIAALFILREEVMTLFGLS